MEIILESLKQALSTMLSKTIINADYQLKEMQAGSVGEVFLIIGTAETNMNEKKPYKMVLKVQKKWNRHGDPNSWSREYDLYISNLENLFTSSIHRPICYHAEINNSETRLWMEYVDGVTALNLTGEMYERIATELGRFQGELYANQPVQLKRFTNLSKTDSFKNGYLYFKSLNGVYDYIRSANCEIPKHLCEMLIETDNNVNEIWNQVEKLPIVLCHRDPFVWNVFVTDDVVTYIDWDSTGWGYMGEDIVNLLLDSADIENMVDYYHKCVPAYRNGFAQYTNISNISDMYITERIITHFGYRLVDGYRLAQSSDERVRNLDTLQRIYEIKSH